MSADVFFDPAAAEMAKVSAGWQRTSNRSGCMTVSCPDCGRKGIIGGAWTASCAYHVSCHLCEFTCVERAIERHLQTHHGIRELAPEQQAVREDRRTRRGVRRRSRQLAV